MPTAVRRIDSHARSVGEILKGSLLHRVGEVISSRSLSRMRRAVLAVVGVTVAPAAHPAEVTAEECYAVWPISKWTRLLFSGVKLGRGLGMDS